MTEPAGGRTDLGGSRSSPGQGLRPDPLEPIAIRLFAWFSGVMFGVCLLLHVLDLVGLVPPLGDWEALLFFFPCVLLIMPGQAFMILILQRGVKTVGRSRLTYGRQWRVLKAAFGCVPTPLRQFSLAYFYVYAPSTWIWEIAGEIRVKHSFPEVAGFTLVVGGFFLVHFLFFAFWLPNASVISSVLTESEVSTSRPAG